MKLWFRLTSVVVVLAVVVVAVVVLTSGGDDKTDKAAVAAKPGAMPQIAGPQLRLGDLIYNISDVHVFDYNSKDARPYLPNMPAPEAGVRYLGVFLRVYNVGAKPVPSAVGFLLEPRKSAIDVQQNIDVQSQMAFQVGSPVAPGGVYPKPGTPAAKGKYPGAMLLYPVSGPTTRAQPFDLVIHDGVTGAIAKLQVPRIKVLPGNTDL